MDAEKLAMQRRIDTLDQHATRLHAALTEQEREIARLTAELETVKRERDALRDGFKMELGCSVCKYFDDDAEYVSNDCFVCGKNKCNWEYRGLCAGNGGIEND